MASSPAGAASLFREKKPPPTLGDKDYVCGVYVDNYNAFSVTEDGSKLAVEGFAELLRGESIGTHVLEHGLLYLEALGLVLGGRQRALRHTSRRVWRFYKATWAFTRRRSLSAFDMEVWPGHAVCLFGIAPHLLAVLDLSYKHVAAAKDGNTLLSGPLRREMQCAAALAFYHRVPSGGFASQHSVHGRLVDLRVRPFFDQRIAPGALASAGPAREVAIY